MTSFILSTFAALSVNSAKDPLYRKSRFFGKKRLRMTMLFWVFFIMVVSPTQAQETVEAVFDNRQWKLGFENYSPEKKAMIKEYVLDGETVENWSELVTVQFFEGMQAKVTVAQFLQKMQTGLQSLCPAVNWRTVSSKDNEAVYQWSLQGCSGQADQTEITRVFAGKEGMHIWHYAVKNPNLAAQKKKEWIDRLNQFKVKLSLEGLQKTLSS